MDSCLRPSVHSAQHLTLLHYVQVGDVGLARVLDNVTHHSNVMEWVRSAAVKLMLCCHVLMMQQTTHCTVGSAPSMTDAIITRNLSVLTPFFMSHCADLRLCGARDASEPAGVHAFFCCMSADHLQSSRQLCHWRRPSSVLMENFVVFRSALPATYSRLAWCCKR